MKENKSQDNKEPKGPYKHFERPKTSRRAMHHRESEPEAEPEVTSRKSTQSEGSPKGPHHSQLWAGLIIVAIIIIALIPIVSSRLHANSNNLAEKSVSQLSDLNERLLHSLIHDTRLNLMTLRLKRHTFHELIFLQKRFALLLMVCVLMDERVHQLS